MLLNLTLMRLIGSHTSYLSIIRNHPYYTKEGSTRCAEKREISGQFEWWEINAIRFTQPSSQTSHTTSNKHGVYQPRDASRTLPEALELLGINRSPFNWGRAYVKHKDWRSPLKRCRNSSMSPGQINVFSSGNTKDVHYSWVWSFSGWTKCFFPKPNSKSNLLRISVLHWCRWWVCGTILQWSWFLTHDQVRLVSIHRCRAVNFI